MDPLPLARLSHQVYEVKCEECLVSRTIGAVDEAAAAAGLRELGWAVVAIAPGYRPQWRCPLHLDPTPKVTKRPSRGRYR